MLAYADHNSEIKIDLEPKPDEPRAFSYISTPPKASGGCRPFDALIDAAAESMGELLKQGDPLRSTRFFRENLLGQYSPPE